MDLNCEYCKGDCENGAVKCQNCGAPINGGGRSIPDYRTCPYCKRKLLALGSPACNYCGRRLPDHYIRAREADLHRLIEMNESENDDEIVSKVDEALRQAARRNRGGSSSVMDAVDIISITDLLT